ncbi:helix-turn-helix domain-containing protein [Candidatus Dependentiae bacterium]|nr:helix-turn-helix domain-containing protein [Candidatus Dependentiae bacterium]
MRTKSFKAILSSIMTQEEIAEIKKQAALEIQIIRFFQAALSDAVNEYMEQEDIGFNELARRLHVTRSQVARIQQGQANLTLSSLAHILAAVGKTPQELLRNKKIRR